MAYKVVDGTDRKQVKPEGLLEKEWQSLYKAAYPNSTTEEQYNDCRKMFYAGAIAVFCALSLEKNVERLKQLIYKIEDEIHDFHNELKTK